MKSNYNKVLAESIRRSLKRRLVEAEQSQDTSDMVNWLNALKTEVSDNMQRMSEEINGMVDGAINGLYSKHQAFQEEFGSVIYQKVDEEYNNGSVSYTYLTNVDGSDEAWESNGSPAQELERRLYSFQNGYDGSVRVDLRPEKNGLLIFVEFKIFDVDNMPKLYADFLNSVDGRLGLETQEY